MLVKLQLTKDKAIEIGIPGGGGKSKVRNDLTGVELYSGCPRGCPAVRLQRRKSEWILSAAGYVKEPDGAMPQEWEEITKQPIWTLPSEFHASGAAIAVNSRLGSFGQASEEAIIQDMIHGVAAVQDTTPKETSFVGADGVRRFGIRRAAPAPKPQPANTSGKRPELPVDSAPVSENGRRFVVRPMAEGNFKLCASLPEFQALWLGRLFKEGKRPTAASIQVAESALMASVLAQPTFNEAKGSIIAVFVREHAVFFAGYKDGEPLLWRRCPSVGGWAEMAKGVKDELGLEESLIDSALEEALIDLRPALEPFVHPVMEQLELARTYLAGKHGMINDSAILLGLPYGSSYWSRYAWEALGMTLAAPSPFEGIRLEDGVKAEFPQDFLPALGAALAASEVET